MEQVVTKVDVNMDEPYLKILLVDDDEDDYVVTRDLLLEAERSQFKLDWVETYEAALALMEQQQYDVYLLDYRLGPRDGLELLSEALECGCQEPIILLTGLGDHDIDMAAMKAGAADYLVKGQLDTPLLERSILHAVERKQAAAEQTKLVFELAAANRELKDFAYIVSHDLKAPLRGIGSLADWIGTDYADRLDEEGQEMLQLLRNRVRRMNDLIDGVLQYSRIGRIHEEKIAVDLNQVVADVVDAIAPPPHIEITIDTELPTLASEKTRIQQIFQNLLSNAVKYIDKSNGSITISCIEENNLWKFSIADNGPGIEEKHFEKIFQIFQTLSPRDESESTGVGLAVVKKIVENYHGRIWLESEIGIGTVFYFTLPQSTIQS